MNGEKRGARRLHRWCGVTVGLLLAAMALTGAGIVFRPQLDPLLYPALQQVSGCAAPLPPSRLVSAARAAVPDAGALSAIRMQAAPAGSAAPVRIRFAGWRWVYVDPCTANVLGIRDAYGGVFGTLAWLHIFGYLPSGAMVAGSVALAAVVLIVAGLALWAWTRPATSAAPPRAGGGTRLNPAARSLRRHRRVALWCAPVLLVLALSGVPQAFPVAATAIHAPLLPLPALQPADAGHAAALDAIWSRLAQDYPGWRQLQWRAGAAGTPDKLEIVEPGAPHDYATGISYYHPATGALLQRTPYAASAAARQAYLWGLALHYGAIGTPWQLVQFATALTVPFLAWTGIAGWLRRRHTARNNGLQKLLVRSKRRVARDVYAFELVHPHGRKLPLWTAGAHIDVHIAPGLVRQYSLCSDPRDRSRYLIAVHRCAPSRGGSDAMHDVVHAGNLLTLGMPRNHFALAPDSPHTILLAGGIGLTPLLAMAETLSARGASYELHYSTRSPVHAAFSERLHEARFCGRVMFHYSNTAGRADFDALLAAPPRGAHLYICGAAGFTDAALAAAARQGWPDSHVHKERFSAPPGPAADGAQAAFDVVLASSGQVVHVAPGQSALAALRAAGVAIPTSCGQGLCGTCVTGVLAGEPDHRDHCLTDEGRETCFTPCCSRARGAQLVLDL